MRLIRQAFLAALLLPAVAGAQSLLDRPPNLSGNWVGAPGSVFFHFIHRFTVGEAPSRKVTNTPTFLLAVGLPLHLLAGIDYSTNSTLSPTVPNEVEYFARWMPVSEDYGGPVDLGGQIGWNTVSKGVDGEISAARKFGIARVIVAGRALSDPFDEGNVRIAAATGATVRLGQYVALAGDVASLLDRDSTERVTWSAGIHFAIPLTPHTFSLQATNVGVTTLQGASRGQKTVRYGFEFTIPLTLRRYFGKRQETSIADTAASVIAARVDSAAPGQNMAGAVVAAPSSEQTPLRVDSVVTMPIDSASEAPKVVPKVVPKALPKVVKTVIRNINYMQPRIEVTVGTTVQWTNNDPLQHSVTAVDKSFNSGLIDPGKSFRHTFTKAGTYSYYCMPHPFMKGVIVVKEP
jgi:Copper binding proteins, plastocyanin/azurin family